jgi:hypothetical protein
LQRRLEAGAKEPGEAVWRTIAVVMFASLKYIE